MAGLASYTRSVSAGKSQKIGARGTVIVARECQGEIEVKTRQTKVGRKDGSTASLMLRRGEKWFSPEEFDEVEVRNPSATNDQEIELLIGGGDFVPPPPNVVVGDSIRGIPSVEVAEFTLILPANPTRKRAYLKAHIDNTEDLFVQEGIEDVEYGLPLSPGESITIEVTGEIYARARNNLVPDQFMFALEENYDI